MDSRRLATSSGLRQPSSRVSTKGEMLAGPKRSPAAAPAPEAKRKPGVSPGRPKSRQQEPECASPVLGSSLHAPEAPPAISMQPLGGATCTLGSSLAASALSTSAALNTSALNTSSASASGKPEDRIRVSLRVRPLTEAEMGRAVVIKTEGGPNELQFDMLACTYVDRCKTFTADQVFREHASQEHVYNSIARGCVSDFVRGYDSLLIAYGQTGTGKTYTVVGNNTSNREDPKRGLLPRAADQIFTELNSEEDEWAYIVSMNMFQIYKEQIFDMLGGPSGAPHAAADKLDIREDSAQGVYVEGLSEHAVARPIDLLRKLKEGMERRSERDTKSNAHSSRSHAVTVITLRRWRKAEAAEAGAAAVVVSRLCVVDMAGSENVKKSGVRAEGMEEAKQINLSIYTLGNVIESLVRQSPHVPYRESRLTRFLEPFLAQSGKVSVVVTLSPSATAYEETRSALAFAEKAMRVPTRAVQNVVVPPEVEARLLRAENGRLREELREARAALEAGEERAGRLRAEAAHQRAEGEALRRRLAEVEGELRDSEASGSTVFRGGATAPVPAGHRRAASSDSDRTCGACEAWRLRAEAAAAEAEAARGRWRTWRPASSGSGPAPRPPPRPPRRPRPRRGLAEAGVGAGAEEGGPRSRMRAGTPAAAASAASAALASGSEEEADGGEEEEGPAQAAASTPSRRRRRAPPGVRRPAVDGVEAACGELRGAAGEAARARAAEAEAGAELARERKHTEYLERIVRIQDDWLREEREKGRRGRRRWRRRGRRRAGERLGAVLTGVTDIPEVLEQLAACLARLRAAAAAAAAAAAEAEAVAPEGPAGRLLARAAAPRGRRRASAGPPPRCATLPAAAAAGPPELPARRLPRAESAGGASCAGGDTDAASDLCNLGSERSLEGSPDPSGLAAGHRDEPVPFASSPDRRLLVAPLPGGARGSPRVQPCAPQAGAQAPATTPARAAAGARAPPATPSSASRAGEIRSRYAQALALRGPGHAPAPAARQLPFA
eukprot:tig00020685_g12932.t1